MNQVTVGATDFEESVAFYRTLGLRLIVSSRGQYARFELPDGEATFSVHLTDHVPSDGPVLYFEVEDVDATVTRLQAEGIPLGTGPEDQPWLGVRHASPTLPAIDCASFTPVAIAVSRPGE
jgi:catechol 2,3-dioxygenase-like lactoylglutathione lyase family enzyme